MQQNRGFTLLELLVVLVLIGIITSFAVLSISTGGLNRQLEQEGRRFISLVEMAGDEALLQSRELGIDFTQTGYRFLHLVEGQWIPYQGDKIFRNRTLPDSVSYQLYIDGLPVVLPEQFEAIKQGSAAEGEATVLLKPQLFILSSGERNPFELQLVSEVEAIFQIDGDMLGELLMHRVESSL